MTLSRRSARLVTVACTWVLCMASLSGCVSFEKTTQVGKVEMHVGEVYELADGATRIWCSQFTFWGIPGTGNTECLVPRGTARPQSGEIAKGDLPGPLRIRITQIKSIGAIDAQYDYVYVEVLPGRKRYVADWRALQAATLPTP